MAIVEHRLDIAAPIAQVFHVSQDYSVRYDWDPFPELIETIGPDGTFGIGTEVRVMAKSGLRMEVRFVQFNAPTAAAIVMTRGPRFLKEFAGSWVFRADGPAMTHARFRYNVQLHWWTLPFISERIAAFYFARLVRQRVDHLQRYCEALPTSLAKSS